MFKVALKGLAGRKLRAVLTSLAIVLGVAMISGTYVLTDTINAGFTQVFTTVYKSTDAIITGKNVVASSNNSSNAPSFPASLLDKVRALPDVSVAYGSISDEAQLVGHNGKVISVGGAPGLAFSVNPNDTRLNPLVLTSGRFPTASNEIAIDAHTASSKHFKVGDTIKVIARGPEQPFKIVGIDKLGGVSSLGGATIAVFSLPEAQKLFHKEGFLDSISIASKANVPRSQLLAEIQRILPRSAQVRSGEEQAKQSEKDTSSFTKIFRYFLLAFAGIALFVGTFVIANTLSITIAQRAREFGTLRTLGASRRQILVSVLIEGSAIGVLASVIGLVLGLGIAEILDVIFKAFGIDLPQTGLVFAWRTVIVSLVVGTLVTLVASLMPAVRATRVEPIAAVREGVLPPSRLQRFGLPVSVGILALALALLLFGALDGSASTSARLLAIGIGVLAAFVGVALLAPKIVPPMVRVLGQPGAAIGGTAGTLARDNAMRNPARTASTAAALMIGLALVTVVAVLAAGLKHRVESAASGLFHADYALTSENGFTPTGIAAEGAVRKVPGVSIVAGVRAGDGKSFGSQVGVTGVTGDVSKVIKSEWSQGSQAVPGELGANGAFVTKDFAKSHHLTIGSPMSLIVPSGKTLSLIVKGVYAPPVGYPPQFGDVAISTQRFDTVYQSPQDVYAFVSIAGGVSKANTAKLKHALRLFPDAKISTESQFVKHQEKGINILLDLLYILLSLAIIVSLFGIVNTLVLTVYERTREIGMLRAVGMTRRQVRRMIRYESIVTALVGAALGIPLGIGLAALVGQAIDFFAFTVPWGSVVAFIVAAIIVGLLAAIFPARRASRLNVLNALQYE